MIVGDPLHPSLEHKVNELTSEFTYKWLDCNRVVSRSKPSKNSPELSLGSLTENVPTIQ